MTWKEAKQSDAINLTEHKDKEFIAYYIDKRKIETDKGSSIIHVFQKDGEEFEVWGFNMLNRFLSNVPKGCLVKVKYAGTKTDEKKDKKYHQCKVLFDPDETIDVESKNNNDDLPF